MAKAFSMTEREGFPFFLQRKTMDIFDLTTPEKIQVGDYLTDEVWAPNQDRPIQRRYPVKEIVECRPARGGVFASSSTPLVSGKGWNSLYNSIR